MAALEVPHIATNLIDRAGVPLKAQGLEHALRGALLTRRQLLFRFQPRIEPSRVARYGPSFGRGWCWRRYSNGSPSERSAFFTVLHEIPRSRAIPLIVSPCTSRRRRIFPIVSTHNTPFSPTLSMATAQGTGWSKLDAGYPPNLINIPRRFTARFTGVVDWTPLRRFKASSNASTSSCIVTKERMVAASKTLMR
jgi:hypothetical protein